MDVNSGHLITDEAYREMQDFQQRNYTPVPKELQSAAEKKLADKTEAMVSLTSGGKLSKWASEQRKNKRKSRAKIAKQSRKQNRN
jgi:hypothetical protein